jgi:hypothetical protein
MSRKRKKKRPPEPTLARPAARPSVRPLSRKDRLVMHLIASPLYMMTLVLAAAAVWFLHTGVATGRGGPITRADDPFGFYFSVVVMIAGALFTGSMGFNLTRTK